MTSVQPTGERQREQTPAGPGTRLPLPPPRESLARRSLAVVLLVALLLSAVVAALVVAKLVNGQPAPAPPRSSTSPTTSTSVAPVKPVKNAPVQPGLEVHPQRARVGPSIQLELRGTGCAGGIGEVTITQIGSARDAVTAERLVLRTRFDVDVAGAWSTSPLLVDQPAGTYRVDAACTRQAVAEDLVPPEQRRDVFVSSETLVLTTAMPEERFEVDPTTVAAHTDVTVTVRGFQRCPAGSQVALRVVPQLGATGVTRDFSTVVGPDTRWVVSIPFAASSASGTYSISATCSTDFVFSNETVQFVSH